MIAASVAGLAACGGDPAATSQRPHPRPAGQLVATVGDSITAGTPAWDPDPGVRATLGTGADRRSQWQYWAARRHRGVRFRNCGVNRERTDQIALRVQDCARGADALVVQGGINDLAQGLPPEAAAANLRAMVRAGKRLGLRVAVAEVLPWTNGGEDAARQIRSLNRQIRVIAAQEEIAVLPFHRVLLDPRRPGAMRPGWTADGDHPSVAGYRRLGERAFRIP